MNPYRRLADDMEAAGRKAMAAGETARALECFDWALRVAALAEPGAGVARLTEAESSANLRDVTGAQLQRRGRAIAKAKSSKSDDLLWKAITGSKWGSQEVYAKKRLGVSPGSLSAYRSGATPCPRTVADKVKADFGIGDSYWRGGVVS